MVTVDPRTPPHNTVAEQHLISAVFTDPRLIETIQLNPEDFYQPANETIWRSILKLSTEGTSPDFVAVHNHLLASDQLKLVGGLDYLHDLYGKTVITSNADHYANIVTDLAGRRRLINQLQAGLEDAFTSQEAHETLVMRAEDRIAKISDGPDVTGLVNFDEFMAIPAPHEDWIIPNLLLRGERLIITGTEGLGKSVLLRQMAVCAAVGMHPFTGKPAPLRNVMYVDAENPTVIMQKTLGQLQRACAAHGHPLDPNRLWIHRRPEGLNLGDPAERLWLRREAATVNADLVCIGPAYKLYFGGNREREEDLARQVTVALDIMRETVGCALVLEHHAPHQESGVKTRSVRPIGSSLWLRWPEFGYGIRLADTEDAYERRLVDLVPWRGPRDVRAWPKRLESAGSGLPWVEAHPPPLRVVNS